MLCCVLQRRGVGGDLVLVFSQLHLVRGEGPAAVRIAVHFDDRALEAEVVGHLANSQPSAGFEPFSGSRQEKQLLAKLGQVEETATNHT